MSDKPDFDKVADAEDQLDGCEVDFTTDPISDHEILNVVFGDDPKKWEEYRKWFAAVKGLENE